MYRAEKLSLLQVTILCSSTMIGAGILTIPRSSANSGFPDGWIIVLIQGVIFAFVAFLLGWIAEKMRRILFLSQIEKEPVPSLARSLI